MKKLLTNLSSTLLLFLLFICQASAQTITVPADLSVTDPNAIFCPPTNQFSLTASTTDAGGRAFTSYQWSEITSGGGGNVFSSETDAVLSLTDVTPGYHTYRVHGIINTQGPSCQSDDFDDFTVYVLPPLTVTAAASNTGTQLKYCENAVPGVVPATTAITLQSTVTLGSQTAGPVTNPTSFAYNYKWFKVNTADNSRAEITGATASSYTIVETTVGTFKYEVEVTYAVKAACGPYKGTVQSGGSDVEVIVVPKPGKPTITLTP